MPTAVERQSTNRLTWVLLLLILLAGLLLRTWNVNFDRGIGSHPDERSTACFYATTVALPTSWEEFRDPTRSPLNPLWNVATQERRSFTYGHFPLYLGVAMGNLFHVLAPLAERLGLPEAHVALMARANSSCDAIAVAGRVTIALLDTLTIFLLFLLGLSIYGRGAGLLAAGFYAFAAQAIQLSHFFAMDPASTAFTVLALLGGVYALQRHTLGAFALTGIGAGLAIASKFSALPILLVPVVAALLVIRQVSPTHAFEDEDDRLDRGATQFRALLGIFVALALAALAFLVTSPYAVLDWKSFIQATLVEQGRMVRGVADFPFTRQYRNTTPYLYFLDQQLRWGLWWPLGLVAAVGMLASLLTLARSLFILIAGTFAPRRRLGRSAQSELILWAWLIPYFGLTGAFLAKFNRYMSPVIPFVLLLAAGTLWRLWQARRPWRFLNRAIATLLALIALLGGAFWSTAYVNGVYGQEHPWISASRWIYENVEEGSVILWELWDDPLPKAIPNEPGMDMGSAGLRNIDWSPYEEDTLEKYEILRSKLREADYVVYSSKRIYDSVDELPERYPMTTQYYAAMWDGSLGFERVLDVATYPQLLGYGFPDRSADESWSLYDHPQVTLFRKVRALSDAEFDALLGGTWETAIPYYRGSDSPLSSLLDLLGLGSSPDAEDEGLINRILAPLTGAVHDDPLPEDRPTLELDRPLNQLALVDDYRWNVAASESPWLAALWWWLAVTLMGWAAFPLTFALFRPLRDRGYLFSRSLGWLLAGWLLWWLASIGILHNTVRGAWIAAAVLGATGLLFAVLHRRQLARFLRHRWQLLLVCELILAAAFAFFTVIRMGNPDLWQPWFGGEKFMEFAFLNGVLRSPSFPPLDPHFASGYINYYYFGIYLVAYVIKLTGIYAEVAFNLAIPTLFALTVGNAIAVAYSAQRLWSAEPTDAPTPAVQEAPTDPDSGADSAPDSDPDAAASMPLTAASHRAPAGERWTRGLGAAMLAPLFVALIGNLAGFGELIRILGQQDRSAFRSAIPGLAPTVDAVRALPSALQGGGPLAPYDFWGPSRVIDFTINEFPYWSFLYADLHPHLIGIPFALLFLGLVLTLLCEESAAWRTHPGRSAGLLAAFSLLLGTLASVNLWELPTYLGLGVLTYVVMQFRSVQGVHLGRTALAALFYLAGAYLAFWPFFNSYVNVGASGVGFVREGDALGSWLLIWGLFLFILAGWILYAYRASDRPHARFDAGGRVRPSGLERIRFISVRWFDRLPRVIYLHRLLVRRSTFLYQLGIWLGPMLIVLAAGALLMDRSVLALCLTLLGAAFLLLWQRSANSDVGSIFVALLTTTGLAVLAGTQLIYLKDFLQGGDYYRMNTLFKFFSQVWVIWGVAAAIALPRVWAGVVRTRGWNADSKAPAALWRYGWAPIALLLIGASLTYVVMGTPVRLEHRFMGWRPPYGTLNGLDFMRQGVYTWPNDDNEIELQYDHEAILWLLDNMRGNAVIVESAHVGYYRAGGSRVASLTGLSGLRGMHAGEQRYADVVGARDAAHREFWETPDLQRTHELIDELQISLIYVGQLERFEHPSGVLKLELMAEQGMLTPIYTNARTTIYAVPGKIVQRDEGWYVPS